MTTQDRVGYTALPSSRPGLMARLRTAFAVRRQRSHLARLEQHELRDIGLSEEAAAAEAHRPFWDVPERWRL